MCKFFSWISNGDERYYELGRFSKTKEFKELCMTAVTKNGYALRYVPEKLGKYM